MNFQDLIKEARESANAKTQLEQQRANAKTQRDENERRQMLVVYATKLAVLNEIGKWLSESGELATVTSPPQPFTLTCTHVGDFNYGTDIKVGFDGSSNCYIGISGEGSVSWEPVESLGGLPYLQYFTLESFAKGAIETADNFGLADPDLDVLIPDPEPEPKPDPTPQHSPRWRRIWD